MLVKLANETIATAQQVIAPLRTGCRIRKSGSGVGSGRWSEASVRVRGLDRRSADDETEQQKTQHAREHAMPSS